VNGETNRVNLVRNLLIGAAGRWGGGIWRSSAAGKVLVISVVATCVAAVGWGAYLLLFAFAG
jgi:hypothetical protein